jgi:hypothetical protein
MKIKIIPYGLILIVFTLLSPIYSSTQEIASESWMDIYFLGAKFGTAHSATTKNVSDHSITYITQSTETIDTTRGADSVSSTIKMKEVEDENFNPKTLDIEMEMSKNITKIHCDYSRDKVTIRIETPEKTTEKERDIDNDLLLSQGIAKLQIDKGFKQGTTYSYKIFYPENSDIATIDVEVLGQETIKYNDKDIPVNKLKSTLKEMGLTTIEYMDDKGMTYISEIPLVNIKYVKVEKPVAKSTESDTKSSELINLSKLGVSGDTDELSDIYNKKKSKFHVSSKEFKLKDLLISDFRQKIKFKGDNEASLTLYSTKNYEPKNDFTRPFDLDEFNNSRRSVQKIFSLEDFEKYTQSSPFIQSDNPKIKNKALEIVKNETDLFNCSKLLCSWVNKNVTNKNYKMLFASALEVLESLEGDCSEHTILFIALARSIGIPTRASIGLVYAANEKSFVFHVWPEVFIGDWVPLDPTFGFNYITAAHLSIIKTDFYELSQGADDLKIFKIIKDFKIQIP